jgi:hypothetical protein
VNRINQETEKEVRAHRGCRAIQEEEEEEEEEQVGRVFVPTDFHAVCRKGLY